MGPTRKRNWTTLYESTITAKVDKRVRGDIEKIAEENGISLGMAVRCLLDEALTIRRLE